MPDGFQWSDFLQQVKAKLRVQGVREILLASVRACGHLRVWACCVPGAFRRNRMRCSELCAWRLRCTRIYFSELCACRLMSQPHALLCAMCLAPFSAPARAFSWVAGLHPCGLLPPAPQSRHACPRTLCNAMAQAAQHEEGRRSCPAPSPLSSAHPPFLRRVGSA